jgi:hypothetical protein
MRKRIYVDLAPDDRIVAAGCTWWPEQIDQGQPTMSYALPTRDLRWSTQYVVSLLLDLAHDGPGDYYETHTDGVLPFPGDGRLDVEGF